MKKFDVFEMKVVASKKKKNILVRQSRIRFMERRDGGRMLNE